MCGVYSIGVQSASNKTALELATNHSRIAQLSWAVDSHYSVMASTQDCILNVLPCTVSPGEKEKEGT